MNKLLFEYLFYGNWGDLRLGSSVADLYRLLGEPDERGTPAKEVVILKYGDLQVSVVEQAVVIISLDLSSVRLTLPHLFSSEFGNERIPRKLSEFLARLDEAGIPYRDNPQLTFGNQRALKVGYTVDLLAETPSESLLTAQSSKIS